MLFLLFLLFTAIPLLELYILFHIGSLIGIWPTVGLVLFTGAAGAWLARRAGRSTLSRIRNRISKGSIPSDELQDGVIILISGALLITPGVITDLVGFAGLVPGIRYLMKKLVKYLFSRLKSRENIFFEMKTGGGFQQGPDDQPRAEMDYDYDVTVEKTAEEKGNEESK